MRLGEIDKKGQGTTFWVIITAVIALVVLVILLMIFTGKTGMFEAGLMSCENKGGECTFPTTGDCKETCETLGKSYSSVFTCPAEKGECCCLGVKEPEK